MILLYDGDCGLCNRSVTFVLDHDPAGRFQFAALMSDIGQRLLAKHGLSQTDNNTVVLIDGDHAHVRSRAALTILANLGSGPYPTLGRIGLWFPSIIGDLVYRLVAANRLRFFGTSENTCRMMRPSLRARFLD